MEATVLEEKLESWKEKVLNSYQQGGGVNTYRMIVDIDKIIAEAFDRPPCMEEVY
mgnify:CR=1 FL=1